MKTTNGASSPKTESFTQIETFVYPELESLEMQEYHEVLLDQMDRTCPGLYHPDKVLCAHSISAFLSALRDVQPAPFQRITRIDLYLTGRTSRGNIVIKRIVSGIEEEPDEDYLIDPDVQDDPYADWLPF